MIKDKIFHGDPAVRLSNKSLCGKAFYRIEKKIQENRMQVSLWNCSDRELRIKEVILYTGGDEESQQFAVADAGGRFEAAGCFHFLPPLSRSVLFPWK